MPDVTSVGPQTDEVILPAALDTQPEVQFGVRHAEIRMLVIPHVRAKELVQRCRRVTRQRLEPDLLAPGPHRVSQVQRLHADELQVIRIREWMKREFETVQGEARVGGANVGGKNLTAETREQLVHPLGRMYRCAEKDGAVLRVVHEVNAQRRRPSPPFARAVVRVLLR